MVLCPEAGEIRGSVAGVLGVEVALDGLAGGLMDLHLPLLVHHVSLAGKLQAGRRVNESIYKRTQEGGGIIPLRKPLRGLNNLLPG